ncbi:hypothetical protein AAMO2058_001425700 [Amorphochlora amoebiformis]
MPECQETSNPKQLDDQKQPEFEQIKPKFKQINPKSEQDEPEFEQESKLEQGHQFEQDERKI